MCVCESKGEEKEKEEEEGGRGGGKLTIRVQCKIKRSRTCSQIAAQHTADAERHSPCEEETGPNLHTAHCNRHLDALQDCLRKSPSVATLHLRRSAACRKNNMHCPPSPTPSYDLRALQWGKTRGVGILLPKFKLPHCSKSPFRIEPLVRNAVPLTAAAFEQSRKGFQAEYSTALQVWWQRASSVPKPQR